MSEKDKKKWPQEFRRLTTESWLKLSGSLSNLFLGQMVRPVSVAQSVSVRLLTERLVVQAHPGTLGFDWHRPAVGKQVEVGHD